MPETFIIYRRRYDKKLRNKLRKKYTEHYDDENDMTNEWWKKFKSLDENRLIKLKKIVSENCFLDNDCITNDILNYYKIKRK